MIRIGLELLALGNGTAASLDAISGNASWDTGGAGRPGSTMTFDFYVTLAQVAATTLGLMLASLQIRFKDWTGPERRSLAMVFLGELLVVLIVALAALTPGLGVRLGAGVGAILGIATDAYFLAVVSSRRSPSVELIIRAVLSVGLAIPVYLVLMCSGAVNGHTQVIGWICTWLIVSGLLEACSVFFFDSALGDPPQSPQPGRRGRG